MAADRARLGTEHIEDGLLEGWKAIADHLGKTERTVQRWEKTRNLPVRRLKSGSPDDQSRVFAYCNELDAWWQHQLSRTDSSVNSDDDSNVAPIPLPEPSKDDSELSQRNRPSSFWVASALGVVLVVIGIRALLPRVFPRIKPVPSKITLVVRPFKNLSGQPSEDFVGAGFTEEMVSRLGQLHPQALIVVRLSPTYANAPPDRLAKDLSADFVLEGSVRHVGDQVAVGAQLVQANSQAVTWGQTYDRDIKDLLRVQVEVTDAIVAEVLNKLPHDSPIPREVNRKAYLDYLEGRYYWNRRTSESLARALKLFQQSIAEDATYAPPYSGLADCYELLGSAPYTTLPPSEAFPKAEQAARKALALDDSLAEAHVSLGYSEMVYEWNLPEAHKEFTRALELRPDYATAHQFYAYYLTVVGELDAAIAERKRALELAPFNPVLASALGEAYYQTRQFDQAIEQNSKALEWDPGNAINLVNIGRAYELKGMHQQARDAFGKILSVAPDNAAVLALLGHEYAVSGEPDKAKAIIAQLKQISARTYVPTVYIALVYTGLHDLDNAFAWLDKAYAERCEYLVYLPTEPLADPLRGDPRFTKLLARLGLKPFPVVPKTAS
jgi:TolB-like protein/Tfp pilus assembly protein PilF